MKSVLLIEDDSAIIDVYETAMKNARIDLEVIRWGTEAIKKIKNIQTKKQKKPGLVLLDLILPDINGMEILKEIKENNETKDIPVFVLSNYTAEALEQAGNIKPEKFILKTNITPTELIELIKKEA